MATTVISPIASRERLTNAPCGCPACGGLECLCRPRFFAGQLLTEEDLNRLDHYIVAKQKLHNRYLHGWGVVCGLDVVCDDCSGGSVVVQPGYALSPCGEDVIVCGDQRVNVCDLIDQCRDKQRDDCDPPGATSGCDDPHQPWVLAICYAETPSRGVAPLRTSAGCACGCGSSGGCGCARGGGKSSSTGGCGCNGASRGTVATTSASRGASLIQCENTIVCESYSFRMYKAPRTFDRKTTVGPMVEAFTACLKEFADSMPVFNPGTTNRQALHDWCCEVHDAFAAWFLSHPPYACELAQRIAAIRCPNPNDADFDSAIAAARTQFVLGALEVLLACFCTALMPPCPTAPSDDCIPLAVITVNTTNGCRVESICNWTTQRKYVTTFPSLQYWLSVLPFGRLLREALESLCCTTFLPRRTSDANANAATGNIAAVRMRAAFNNAAATEATSDASHATTTGDSGADVSPSSAFHGSPQSTAKSRAFLQMAMGAFSNRDTSANAERLVLGLLGEKDAQGQSYISQVESENLLQYLVLDQMAKPTMRSMLDDKATGLGNNVLLRALGSMFGGASDAATTSTESAATSAQLDELRTTVAKQQKQLDELVRTRKSRGKNK